MEYTIKKYKNIQTGEISPILEIFIPDNEISYARYKYFVAIYEPITREVEIEELSEHKFITSYKENI